MVDFSNHGECGAEQSAFVEFGSAPMMQWSGGMRGCSERLTGFPAFDLLSHMLRIVNLRYPHVCIQFCSFAVKPIRSVVKER